MGFQPTTRTVADVISRIKRQFGDEASVQVTDSDIISHINSGQLEIARMNGVLRDSATTAAGTGTDEYLFPTEDILKVQSIRVNNVTLEHRSFQEAEDFMLNWDPDKNSRGMPEFWYEWGNKFYIYPIPEKDYTLRINFIRQPSPVTTSSDLLGLPDVYFDAICQYVMANLYEMDEDWEASAYKAQQYTANVMSLSESDKPDNRAYPTITVLEDDL